MSMSSNLVLFCFAALVLIVTPGPNFFYILTRGATQGRRAGLVAASGLGAGVLIHTALATLGIAALVRSSYLAFRVIKYGGSLYLVYLGVRALRDRPVVVGVVREVSEHHYRVFWQSIVASMTNPKTILFFLSFLPQFVNAEAGDAARQMLLLGTIYMLLTLLVYGLVGYYAGSAGRWLRARETVASRLRWLTATSFIGLGVWAALPDRR
jgi:threonine/homoserine/homoserine lactone efflux protein